MRFVSPAIILFLSLFVQAQTFISVGPDGGDVRSLSADPATAGRILLGTSAGQIYPCDGHRYIRPEYSGRRRTRRRLSFTQWRRDMDAHLTRIKLRDQEHRIDRHRSQRFRNHLRGNVAPAMEDDRRRTLLAQHQEWRD